MSSFCPSTINTDSVYLFPGAAVTKNHSLGDLTIEIYFLPGPLGRQGQGVGRLDFFCLQMSMSSPPVSSHVNPVCACMLCFSHNSDSL